MVSEGATSEEGATSLSPSEAATTTPFAGRTRVRRRGRNVRGDCVSGRRRGNERASAGDASTGRALEVSILTSLVKEGTRARGVFRWSRVDKQGGRTGTSCVAFRTVRRGARRCVRCAGGAWCDEITATRKTTTGFLGNDEESGTSRGNFEIFV